MRKKEEKQSVPALGGSSLLVIFGVLCLTMLAMLSLDTALAQRRLSDSAVDAISAYYRADLEAETIFARLRSGEKPENVEQSGDHYRYSCPISRQQNLAVELKRTAEDWTVLRWQAVAEDIAIDDSLPVWNAEGTP